MSSFWKHFKVGSPLLKKKFSCQSQPREVDILTKSYNEFSFGFHTILVLFIQMVQIEGNIWNIQIKCKWKGRVLKLEVEEGTISLYVSRPISITLFKVHHKIHPYIQYIKHPSFKPLQITLKNPLIHNTICHSKILTHICT